MLADDEVARLIDPVELDEAITAALCAVSEGAASVPARLAAMTPSGLLGAMPGYVPALGLGAKLVTYFRHNPGIGLPAHQAVVVLADPDDGRLLAVLGATHITAVRTASAAAVAARALAPPEVSNVVIIGTGVQARSHLDVFARTFPAAVRLLAGRNLDHVQELAAAYSGVQPMKSVPDAVRRGDVVCLCTDADEPVIEREWLVPGAHVSSVGSGVEVDAATVAEAAVFVESRAAATQPFPAGSRELAGRDPASVAEIGEVLLGRHPGRTAPEELTLYKSMGHASEDIAAAVVAYRAAVATEEAARSG
jgi:ornithine cyclodeaminase